MKTKYFNPQCDMLILENAEETLLNASSELGKTEEASNPWIFE